MEKLVNGTKYNKSEIMREAWNMIRHGSKKTFGECLRLVWAAAKSVMAKAVAAAKKGEVVRMLYREYKKNYSGCRTVADSYDSKTKTIEVFVNQKKNEFSLYVNRNGRKIRYL